MSSNRAETSLKGTARLVYSVHVVIEDVHKSFRMVFIENYLTLDGLLPVMMDVYGENEASKSV